MRPDEQLEWEARWSRPVAIASVLAALLTLASVPLFLPEDREGIDATADFLLSIDDNPGTYLASAVVGALAVLFLIAVFRFLFRGVTARGAGVPRWFVYLVFGAPIAYAVARVAYAIDVLDAADDRRRRPLHLGERAERRRLEHRHPRARVDLRRDEDDVPHGNAHEEPAGALPDIQDGHISAGSRQLTVGAGL